MTIRYTKREEQWNSWSHAFGIILGLTAGIVLLTVCFQIDNHWVTAGVLLYVFGLLSSYTASTVYHATSRRSRWKERLRQLDHAAIYWHIAGSYSPITLVALREQGYWGVGLFIFIWSCAMVGTVISFVRLKEHSNLETLSFICMGLSVLIAFKPLVAAVSTNVIMWIVAEGVCYITGAMFYNLNKRRFMHTVFHFFVLGGSICHIIVVWNILREYMTGVMLNGNIYQ